MPGPGRAAGWKGLMAVHEAQRKNRVGRVALAGVLLIPIVLESGVKWGFMVYAVVGILNAILTPSLEAKVLFIAFFGYYPVLKALIERIRFRPLEWAAKLLLFNGTFVAAYWLMLHVFALPADSLELFGVNVPLLLLGAGNIVFVIYDVAVTNLIVLYQRMLRPKLLHIFRI